MRKWQAAGIMAVILIIASVAFIATRAPFEEGTPPSWEDAELRVRIDVSERRLYVEEWGEAIESWPVAVGTKQHPTPRGTFSVQRVIWNPRWVPPAAEWAEDERPREPGDPKNPMGRVKIFFKEPDYYVHGTNAESSIGTAASHGCVRMRNADVIELGRMLVQHGATVEPGLIRRLINRVRQTREIGLVDPVPLRVQM